jgi:hypothetical protein
MSRCLLMLFSYSISVFSSSFPTVLLSFNLLNSLPKVADLLSMKFVELVSVAEKFTGQAVFIGGGGKGGDSAKGYLDATKSSSVKSTN